MSVWEIEKFAVASVMTPHGCFSFYCSFSGFLNNETRNLFKNMINYIFENLPVPVKHFCDPGVAKLSTNMINIYKKKTSIENLFLVFSFTMTMDILSF